MAAYASLVSLMHIIEQIENHPRPPISLNQEQVQSLSENITFLQDFLETYNFHAVTKEAEDLMSRIADAAYAAEDIIESHVVDQILAQSTSTHDEEKIGVVDLYQGLEKVIQDMDFIKKDVMKIKDRTGDQDQLHGNSAGVASSRSPSMRQNTAVVGIDDVLYEILDKLTGQQSRLHIIPIVGMGGIGKTTLAKCVYENELSVDYFDLRAWVTVSQEDNVNEILSKVKEQVSEKNLSGRSEGELGEMVYKILSGHRYLIILDDMWSTKVWDKMKLYFPNNNNGSRIIVTTRISKVAMYLTDERAIELNFLDEEKSWNLLRKIVFGEEGRCPLELEKIGKKIAKNCKGLPLSIVVIGGLLVKSDGALKYWEYVTGNLNSIVNLEDHERCLKILQTSYHLLPVHLKPCFLYMGIFPEDNLIRVSRLIKLWVAEGFLKPISGKSLEVVAEEYLKDLVNRNLILVGEWGSTFGKIKSCTIHDLLRDLCLREAQTDKFLCATVQGNFNIPHEVINTQRRIVINERKYENVKNFDKLCHALQAQSLARSLICNSCEVLQSPKFRLLRVLNAINPRYRFVEYDLEAIFQLVNSRHISITSKRYQKARSFPSLVHLLWNLQTLIVKAAHMKVTAPFEIWKMPLLRHVEWDGLYFPDPPSGGQDDFVLGNLHTLSKITNFKCGEEVVKRIPNVKKLKISYKDIEEGIEVGSHFCLKNLGHLHKLESLGCFFYHQRISRRDLLQNLDFPHSLKKLTLYGCRLNWDDMNTKIGSLPLLQVLKLCAWSFIGPKWETIEGKFCSLRFLLINYSDDLKYWTTESTHFPRLEHLHLRRLGKLKEIPSDIGEIPTLKSVRVESCCDSTVISAKKVVEEQEELGNESLQVQVILFPEDQHHLKGLATRNFQVNIIELFPNGIL